jgi:hypothetical protein
LGTQLNSLNILRLKQKKGKPFIIKSNKIKNPTNTKLEQVMKLSTTKTKNEAQLEKDNKIVNKKYQEVLQAGRQIFAVSINLLQIIHNIKDSKSIIYVGGNQKYDALNDTI